MIFPGGSTFATDFQQVIDRAVAIAALPLSQLNAQKTVLTSRASALAGISERFTELQTAITSVSSAIGSKIHSASVTDETVAKVTLGANVLAANYALEVISLGSRTLTLGLDSLPPVSDPFTETVSASTDYTLTVDGADYAVASTTGSLFDLASAINASSAGVQATVVNIGGSAGPDYRLSIQSEQYAGVTIQLNDGSQDLLETLTTGTPVVYTVNGVPAGGISTDSRTVTLSPGLTVDLLKTGTTDIAVSKTASSLADAVAGFVTAYNGAVSKLDLHRGTAGGVLSGHVALSTMARSLSGIAGYAAAGAINSLADLGISLDDQGKLSLDRDVLEAKPVSGIVSFLGDSTTGFLKAAGDAMTSLHDSSDGLLALEQASLDRQLKRQDELIAANEERIETLRQSLTLQMARADGVIAVLEQQVVGIQGLFEAMRASQKSK